MKIITKTGKSFPATWAGISSLDKSLRFNIQDCTILEAAKVFSDEKETEEITYQIGEEESGKTVFDGFTKLTGINIYGADTNVTLQKGSD